MQIKLVVVVVVAPVRKNEVFARRELWFNRVHVQSPCPRANQQLKVGGYLTQF